MTLHHTTLGTAGGRVVFLHGLFGQGRNWTTIARALAGEHRIALVDLPQHGRSPWSDHFDYVEMVDQVAELIADEPAAVVGHSMGGKVAMLLALLHPDLVTRLVVADMSPVRYDGGVGGLGRYARALLDLDLAQVRTREDADRLLEPDVPDATIRSFLLQNLRRDSEAPSGWAWQPNLAVLERDMAVIADWPEDRLAGVPAYERPVLWMAGGRSDYVREEYAAAMDRWFPRNRTVVLKQAGHWLHSEQPELFTEVLRRFLDA
ncbi:alpha/beta fold hydrolase [Nocardioides ultimimeridianus]